jgi:sugar phosphate isomerase/epimerase
MQRREFLRSTVLGAVAAGAASAPGAKLTAAVVDTKKKPADKPTSKVAGRLPGSSMQLSLAAYSFRKELSGKKPTMTLDQFVDFCAGLDLHATELTEYYFRQKDPEYLVSLRRRAYVNGLAISGAPLGNNFCLPPGAKRTQQIAHVKRWIDNVALLGAQTIRVFAGTVPKGVAEEQARDWAIEGLKDCVAYAAKKGVLLALENHGGLTARAEQLLALVRGVDSPWLGVNLDTGNFHHRVYESLELAAPYAVAVQVKVETREGNAAAQPTDYRRIVQILDNAGYRGYVALEYEAKEDPRTAVPIHLAKLRDALA